MIVLKFRAWDGLRMTTSGIQFSATTGILAMIKDMPIMQFTGLKDKNGVEIYEGDIVKHVIREPHEWFGLHEVVWDSARFCLKGGNPHGLRCNEIFNWYPMNVEVIGNIYEQPELLKEDA